MGRPFVFYVTRSFERFLNPEALRCNLCAFAHGLELCPDDGRMDFRLGAGLGTKAAIATRNHPFASHYIRITFDPVRDQLGVFDEHG